jgi:glycosyltransferase involved in cell wall biosynthesis
LVEPGNIPAFANAITAYCNDASLRTAHGTAGELRSRNYAWDAINHAVAEAYLRLIDQKASKPSA